MIKILVIDCGRPIIQEAYTSTINMLADVLPATEVKDLNDYELVVLPSSLTLEQVNVIKDQLHKYLNNNGVVFCFSADAVDALPHNAINKSKKVPEIHYTLYDDTYGFFKDVDTEVLNSISQHKWSSQGFIESEHDVQVVVCSYEKLPVMVVDEISTSGTMVITAGLGMLENTIEGASDPDLAAELSKLWENMLSLVSRRNPS